MTVIRRDGKHQSPFLEWIRSCPELDSKEHCICVIDNDIWVHRFSKRNEKPLSDKLIEHLQLIEFKTFNASMPFAQRDTLQVVDLLIRRVTTAGSKRRPITIPDFRFGRPGCKRQVRWLGLHVLQLSCDRPDNSDRIIWDGKYEIDKSTLIKLLRFDNDPDHPNRLLDTRRHHLPSKQQLHPKLFIEAAE